VLRRCARFPNSGPLRTAPRPVATCPTRGSGIPTVYRRWGSVTGRCPTCWPTCRNDSLPPGRDSSLTGDHQLTPALVARTLTDPPARPALSVPCSPRHRDERTAPPATFLPSQDPRMGAPLSSSSSPREIPEGTDASEVIPVLPPPRSTTATPAGTSATLDDESSRPRRRCGGRRHRGRLRCQTSPRTKSEGTNHRQQYGRCWTALYRTAS